MRKIYQIIGCFALNSTAGKTAEIAVVSRPNATKIFVKIRQRIAQECERALATRMKLMEVDLAHIASAIGERSLFYLAFNDSCRTLVCK